MILYNTCCVNCPHLHAAPAPAGRAGGLTSPCRKIGPLGDCMGRPVTCPSYAYPVGTVVFDANNHEANEFPPAV